MPIVVSEQENLTIAGDSVQAGAAVRPVPSNQVDDARSVRSWRDRTLTLILFGLSLTSVVGWGLLVRDWGLLDHYATPFFSFEKVEGEFDSPILRRAFAFLLAIGFAYAGILAVLRSTASLNGARWVALAIALVGPAIASVLLFPVGALDVFNYLIELKVAFHFDQNPYLVTAEAYQDDPFARSAFLIDIPLFYGPVWLLVSAVPLLIVGFTDALQALIALKVLHLALLVVTAVLVAFHHRDARARWTSVVFLLANPLILFEAVANVHNDVVMTVFIVAALVSLKRRSVLAGPLLALAVMVKLYAAALAPLFIAVALRDRWPWRRSVTTTVLALLAIAAVSMPYWAGGRMLEGFEAGLSQSQEMDHVSPLSIALQYEQQLIAADHIDPEFIQSRPSFEILPEAMTSDIRSGFMTVFVALAIALAVSAWKGRAEEIVAAETLLVLLLLTTNLYPWYLIPIVALFALGRDRLGSVYIAVATVLGLAYYPMYVYAHYNTEWDRFDVHLFLALFLTVPMLLYLGARIANGARFAWRSGRIVQPPLGENTTWEGSNE